MYAAERLYYDFLVYLYVFSLIFALADVFRPNPITRRFSYRILFTVWGLQTVDVLIRALDLFPEHARFDPIILFSWSINTFTLIMNRVTRMDLFVFFANLIGFTAFAIQVFFAREDISYSQQVSMLSELVFIHVTFALMSYAAFSLSWICSLLYIIHHSLLKKKKWNTFSRRLPSLTQLQTYSIWLNVVGFLLLLVSLLLGMIWAVQTIRDFSWFDIKIVGSIAVLFVYSIVLFLAKRSSCSGRQFSRWNLFALLIIVLNIFASVSGWSFHHWI